ncbi:MAG: hypothetical protein LBL38_03740 [Lactobacillales bacterium]|jgi:hypothetical protein|nr:hypothetical protein [Lactobacillales bacterium]
MFKIKYKSFVLLFIVLVFFNPVRTLAMLDDDSDKKGDTAAQIPSSKDKTPDAAGFALPSSDDSDMAPPSPPPEKPSAPSVVASVDYNRQLEAIFVDPAKQERIEVRVITELHKIDQSGVFSRLFVEFLNQCNDLRTLKLALSDPSKMVYKIPLPVNRIKEYENFDENQPIFQSALASKAGEISWQLLEYLYDQSMQSLSLTLIRRLNDMQNENPNNALFFTRINQLFYHSRRLLAVTICPQIIKEFGITDAQNVRFRTEKQQITDDPNAGRERNTQVCEFISQGNHYACLLSKKTGGVHFGGLVKIGIVERIDDSELPILKSESKRTYFLKAYHGYPATESKDSGDTKLDTTQMVTSTKDAPENLPVKSLDLREPLVYSVLAKLGLGPRVHFMVNEYINNGFFIVTEGLSTNGEEFVELEKIDKILQTNQSNPTNINAILNPASRYPLKGKIICDLTLASIFVNIFRLTDIKGDNIGYVASQPLFNELAGDFDFNPLRLMMIDFLTPLLDASQSPISESFLQGTCFSESSSGVKPYESIISQCEESFRSLLPYITTTGTTKQRINEFNIDSVKESLTTFKQVVSRKVFEGQGALGEFQVRVSRLSDVDSKIKNFDDMLEQAKTEILGLLEKHTSIGIPLPVVLRLELNAAGLLSDYMKLSCQNYHELEEFLNRDYEAWIDSLTSQVQELINKFESDSTPS